MKQPTSFPVPRGLRASSRVALWAFWTTALLAGAMLAQATESTDLMIKPPVALPGGLSLHPVITSVTQAQNSVTVQWFGLQGPFQLLHSPTANSNDWQQLGAPTFRSGVTVPLTGDLGFFRVLSGTPTSTAETGGTMNYVGAFACAECHEDTVQEWAQTPHARALDSLTKVGQQNNSACLVCHTVGFETPLGFKSAESTPHLSGTQCENCHGPAGSHIANVRDKSVRPKVTMAAEVCGGCHNYHHATFDEWKQSAHATPVAEVSASILQQGEPRMLTCGVCHSGAVRESLLEGLEHPGTILPNRIDAAYFGVTCAVCHDAHANMDDPPRLPNPLLRNPVYSLANFSYTPSSDPASFAAQYNPDIQVCAQCHNMRGARWQDTSRPPHHSPQYNLLVGKGAYDLGQPIIAAHGADIPNQCIRCHTQALPPPAAPAPGVTDTNYLGHTFNVAFEGCAECHITSRAAEAAVKNTQQKIKSDLADLKALLDQWATSKAPADLQAKYGALAWEYNIPGEISNPAGATNIVGPTTAEQARIPDAIKQARLNVYLVQYDGSFGVHNGAYTRYLLQVAKTNVTTALNQP